MLSKTITLLITLSFISGSVYAANDWLDAGKDYLARQELDKAIFCYTKAIEENPVLVEAYLKRAELYQMKGEIRKSAEDKRKAYTIDFRAFDQKKEPKNYR